MDVTQITKSMFKMIDFSDMTLTLSNFGLHLEMTVIIAILCESGTLYPL